MNRTLAAGVVVLLVGVALFAGGIYFTVQQERQLSDLKQTNGTVLSASVESRGDGYYPNVTYTYRVDGTNYTSSNIWPAQRDRAYERSDAEEVVGRYAENQTVKVYYTGDNASDASLRAPRSPTPVFAIGAGFVTMAFGFLFVVAGRQRDRPPIETDEVTLPDRDPSTDDSEDSGDSDDSGDADGDSDDSGDTGDADGDSDDSGDTGDADDGEREGDDASEADG